MKQRQIWQELNSAACLKEHFLSPQFFNLLPETTPVRWRQQVQTFTVEELVILNQYASPHERFIMLCGLNCGFKRMEIGTLRVGELSIEEIHPHAKLVDFDFTGTESFIRRFRTKTEVFGEWYLWPLTVTGMKWAIERHKQQTQIVKGQGAGTPIPFSPNSLLYLNDCGHSFTKKTANGNSNNQLTTAWNRLLRRVRKDYPEFRWLPHEALRDTTTYGATHPMQ